MQQMPWCMQKILQCKKETGQALLRDEQTLSFYSQDFGKIIHSLPNAVCIPETQEKMAMLLQFANQQKLPITIRGKGLSQGGQSLAKNGGLTLHLQYFTRVLAKEPEAIWVEANATWAELLEKSLKTQQIPFVTPYNCQLSIGGVLSAGGIGASSFRYGPISANVKALEVVTCSGEMKVIEDGDPLFSACLSGQGRFAVISKACIRLRPCLPRVKTFYFVYLEEEQWLQDLQEMNCQADYIEAFCSPALQGGRLIDDKRQPFAQWIYSLQVSFEYDKIPPKLLDLKITPWKLIHQQEESIHSYLHRHDARLESMRLTGQWELPHPWYECFISKETLISNLSQLLAELPLSYVTLLQVVPIANKQPGFFMLPDANEVFELMILNPGVNPHFLKTCLEAISKLDERFLKQGGKRYLSGYLGSSLEHSYWQTHFSQRYEAWEKLKKEYDPNSILGSLII